MNTIGGLIFHLYGNVWDFFGWTWNLKVEFPRNGCTGFDFFKNYRLIVEKVVGMVYEIMLSIQNSWQIYTKMYRHFAKDERMRLLLSSICYANQKFYSLDNPIAKFKWGTLLLKKIQFTDMCSYFHLFSTVDTIPAIELMIYHLINNKRNWIEERTNQLGRMLI